MQEKVFNFQVEMSCEGCSNALQKVLTKNKDKGIADFNIDLPSQKVSITSSNLSSEELLAIVEKTGKKTTFLSEEIKN